MRVFFAVWAGLGAVWQLECRALDNEVFAGPSPYLSFADSPFNNTNLFQFFYLEDFEDGSLSTPGAGANPGWRVLPPAPLTDSVDADDGAINGSGSGGHSFFSNVTSSNLTVTFNASALGDRLPTHAGIACTDIGAVTSGVLGIGDVTFEARDANGVSLGSITASNFGNGSVAGSGVGATSEDRFFGVVHLAGISSISLSVNNSVDWEVDHLQYGRFEPALRIELAAPGSAVIAWSTNAPGLELQETSDLTAGYWTAVTNQALIVGGERQVTVSPPTDSRFYRLVIP